MAFTNTEIVDPPSFLKLVKDYDVRVFGFLIGNSANWPLLRMITETTGGFYAGVSNPDDVIGQILLAKSKITAEALHDATQTISDVKVFDGTDQAIGKIYRGQQLVLFGRYDKGGKATVTLKTKMTGEDKTYTTTFNFPDLDTSNPEIERLWALNRIEAIDLSRSAGRMPAPDAEQAIRTLGVGYQLVTDYTSMLVLADEEFQTRGIERKNRERVALERQARAARATLPAPPRCLARLFRARRCALLVPATATYVEFDRSALRAGEVWRLLTCHWGHWSLGHLFWDTLASAVLGAACERVDRRRFLGCILVSALLIPLAILWFQPGMTSYRGLSGLDSALFVLLTLAVMQHANARAARVTAASRARCLRRKDRLRERHRRRAFRSRPCPDGAAPPPRGRAPRAPELVPESVLSGALSR